jgi:hypothetical protein
MVSFWKWQGYTRNCDGVIMMDNSPTSKFHKVANCTSLVNHENDMSFSLCYKIDAIKLITQDYFNIQS